MSIKQQSVLASRPAAMVLALSLVAGLTAPFLMLSRVHAATTPLTCKVNNANGCTELSPTPPEDTVAVPANIVLMLDDSGSMSWNFMPDWSYLKNNGNNDALIDASNNGVYYNPAIAYTPPPKADGTSYTVYTDMSNVAEDGFGVRTTASVNLFTYNGNYEYRDCGGVCGGSDIDYNVSYPGTSKTDTYTNVTRAQCDANYASTANAYNERWSQTSIFGSPAKGTCKIDYYAVLPTVYFQYSTGPANGSYTVYYVAPASQGCGSQPHCVVDTSSSGFKDADNNDISVGQNIANWFAYYHTRILMAKSGLMTAFDKLNSKYRFGFGSIDGGTKGNKNYQNLPSSRYSYSDGYNGGTNYIAQVQPFGDATDATSQRAAFWNWISQATATGGTPLRQALYQVGNYYQTSQPWTTMSSDPGWTTGSTTKFACRASYAILTTDGFWNGPSQGVGNVDNNDGPDNSPVPPKAITRYTATPPFSDSVKDTLADVAMYYWENDLQPDLQNEVAANKDDPATWQHMATFTVGLGFDPPVGPQSGGNPNGIMPAGTTIPQIFAWANDGGGTSSTYAINNFSWPTPSSSGILNNIADLAHAAVNGHGDFFSVKSPQDLAAGFAKAISEINGRTNSAPAASVNASVVAVGAVGFGTSYNTGDWSGQLEAVPLLADGSVDSCSPLWNVANGFCAETGQALPPGTLDAAYHSKAGYVNRSVYTLAYAPGTANPFPSFQFTSAASNVSQLDASETAGLQAPTLGGGNDTLANRINYLLGDNEFEGSPFRTRNTLLGAVIHAQPVYVGYPTGNYFSFPAGTAEATAAAASSGTDDKSYDSFVARHASRAPTVYLGANDGMLHAFNAPVPQCATYSPATQTCSAYTPDASAGKEDWAFIPRAVYANLGNLTNANFQFRPTVDAAPVTRDVFFDGVWHTILAGGVGLGGRGVYALDITGPANSSTPTTKPTVLWEFDADMTDANGPMSGCVSNAGTCAASDLGFTASQPNIGRLANGKWVVIVPNGYFPDCTTPDIPTDPSAPTGAANNCQTVANQAPGWASGAPYSALFVLDAQTGKVLAELKTPQITGVTSFGLATPVLGDYNNDQIDDVAFAGDAMGNLWRFDLSGSTPSSWKVTLAYKGGTAKDPSGNTVLQPITSMPRLFPDPTTNRFMVVFGTGRFLGVGDNSNKDVQALYGVRDQGNAGTSADAYTQADLVQQYLHETTIPAGAKLPDGSPDPNAGASLRCVTGSGSDTCAASASGGSPSTINPVPSSKGGWYISLQTKTSGGTVNDAGERVVVNPGAIFASNTVVFETLITGSQSSDPCSPTTVGSIMALNALTGGPSGVSSLGGGNIVGGRINNARTSGNLPLVSALGGGQAYLPGTTLAPNGTSPLSIDSPIWRRRSWNEIKQN